MRYHDITKDDMQNGDGLLFDEDAKKEIFLQLEEDYISGITFSGGDPLFPGNRDEVTALAREIKNRYPSKNIWLYTGFLWEQIKDLEIISYIDVLVDGPYKKELRDETLHWVGSSNQRIIQISKETKENEKSCTI